MTYLSNETLIKVRDRLKAGLDLMHDEADASAKKEVRYAIARLDGIIESDDPKAKADLILRLIGKIVDKLPLIVSLMRDLD